MPWNYVQAELVPEDATIRPLIGPGNLTREEAKAEIQSILDQGAAQSPQLMQLAETWKRGAKDNTLFLLPITWAIYEHSSPEDSRAAAAEWLEGFAGSLRAAGIPNANVGQLPK